MNIQAIIFDMDGLLIDSEPFWRSAHMTVVRQKGFTITEDDVRQSAGKGTDTVVQGWQQRFGWPESENFETEARIVQQVVDEVRQYGTAKPGVNELITQLKNYGVPLAVASSSSPELIDTVLRKLDLTDDISVVHSARNEARSKPYPDVFLSTAKSLLVRPADCLVFEDSLNGVIAAKAAGMRCIAVPEAPYDRAAFMAAGADLIVESLIEVSPEDII